MRACASQIYQGYSANKYAYSDPYLKRCLEPLGLVGCETSRWSVFQELGLYCALPFGTGEFRTNLFLRFLKLSSALRIGR